MFLLYHAYVYLEFLILACTIYILAPTLFYYYSRKRSGTQRIFARILRNPDKSILHMALRNERHVRIEIAVFVILTFVPLSRFLPRSGTV